jgi:hypothetical protein
MLMGATNRAIDHVGAPIKRSSSVGLLLDDGEYLLPQATRTPAIKATGHRLPGTIPCWEITPGRSSFVDPQQAIHDAAMILIRPPLAGPALWRQQRSQRCPLGISQFMASDEVLLDPL